MANRRPDVAAFSFRLNSLEYQNLQDKVRQEVTSLFLQNLQLPFQVSATIENIRNVQVRDASLYQSCSFL